MLTKQNYSGLHYLEGGKNVRYLSRTKRIFMVRILLQEIHFYVDKNVLYKRNFAFGFQVSGTLFA